MKESILFFGTPPAYFAQLLQRYGSVSYSDKTEDWRAHTIIGVSGNSLTPEVLKDLSRQVLASGKGLGLLETDSANLEILSTITGIHPYESCAGAIISPWTDETGRKHYKTVFFHRFTEQREAALAARGQSADTLKYLLLKNALRMHFEDLAGREQYLKFIIPATTGYAIVPIQKRPVTAYTNGIHGLTEVRFFHHADVWFLRPYSNSRELYIIACHYLTGFSYGLYHYRQAHHLTETAAGPAIQLNEWQQYVTWSLRCTAEAGKDNSDTQISTDLLPAEHVGAHTVFAGGISPSTPYIAALQEHRHRDMQAKAGSKLPGIEWSLSDTAKQQAGKQDIPVPGQTCCGISVTHIKLNQQDIPGIRLSFHFGIGILQEETVTAVSGDGKAFATTATSHFEESKTLHSEWIYPATLLQHHTPEL